MPMFWSESPGIAQTPETLGKKQSKQREEKSGHLMPQCTASGGKCFPESSTEPATALRRFAHQVAAGNRTARLSQAAASVLPGWRAGSGRLGLQVQQTMHCPWKSHSAPAPAEPSPPDGCRSQAFDLDEPYPHRKSVAAGRYDIALFSKPKYGKKNATISARGG